MGERQAQGRNPASQMRYAAFISYSHRDEKHAAWLHRALEMFKAPADITIPQDLPNRDRRLSPVFRDREELSSSHDLSESIQEALASSNALIVICSPAAAKSRWVNEEIKTFKQMHGEERVFALIVEGEDDGPEPFFPEALLQKIGPDGSVLDERGEPLAADIRAGKDGKRHAKLKLAAGILDVGLDSLAQRDAARERQQMMRWTALSTAAAVFAIGLAFFAFTQREQAREQRIVAEQQSDTANAALDYLVSLFEIANPATENPKTITALTILERGRDKIDTELADKPAVQAKLRNAIGSVYHQLGDIQQAKPILAKAAEGPFASFEDEFFAKIDYLNALTRLREFEEADVVFSDLEKLLANADNDEADLSRFNSSLFEQKALSRYLQADSAQAVEWYRKAKAQCDESDPEQRQQCGALSSSLGMILVQRKNFDEGIRELEYARELISSVYGDMHLKTAIIDHNMGYADFEAEHFEEAIEKMAEAIAVYNNLLEDNHPLKGDAELVMGRIYDKSDHPAKAVPHLKRSRDIYAAAFGENNPKVGYGWVFLALSQARADLIEDAYASLEAAQSIYQTHFEAGSFDMIDLQIYTAWIDSLAGRHEKASRGCQDGLAAMKQLGEEGPYFEWLVQECANVEQKYNSSVQ